MKSENLTRKRVHLFRRSMLRSSEDQIVEEKLDKLCPLNGPLAVNHVTSDYTLTADDLRAITNSNNQVANNKLRHVSNNESYPLTAAMCKSKILYHNKQIRYSNASNERLSRCRRVLVNPIVQSSKFSQTPLLALLVLSTCLLAIQAQALYSSSDENELATSSSASSAPLTQAASKQASSDRQESSASGQGADRSPNSIVASLSSAVASAAAAAAVAAAQNGLSGSDGRSLISGSSSASHSHAKLPRSPGINLAIKLADAIPEVPYNILHNMKKIDHAAPFYNVQNKIMAPSAGKESFPSIIVSALSGSGGAADQLTAMFRSPLWKRIADGYGEFTSEFRSLFRAPPSPMKGPSKSTSKLLRDISVPALLMLLASTMPTDWRPTRTRRKSIPLGGDLVAPSSILSNNDPISMAANELPNFSLPPQLLRSVPNLNMAMQSAPQGLSTPLGQSAYNHHQQVLESGSQSLPALARASDINLQPSETGQQANWINSVQRSSLSGGQNHLISADTSQMQQTIKRIGDLSSVAAAKPTTDHQHNLKPVIRDRLHSSTTLANQPKGESGIFSSLTSGLANMAQSKFMNRLMNANRNHDVYRMMSLTDTADHKVASARRDHLDDKHKYSLVGADDFGLADFVSVNGVGTDVQRLSPPSKPLLSAMTHTVASMLSPAHESGYFKNKPAFKTGSSLEVNQDIGDKKNYQQDGLARRQASLNGVEQRDLSLLLPQSWKEIVKRTVNSVQQQASTQWRSIEGQVTNWVQDKLKAFPAPVSAQTPQPTGGNQGIAAASVPVANIIASVSSTAMNILGLGNKGSSAAASHPVGSISVANETQTPSSDSAASPSATTATGQRNKSETNKPAKGALAGVADLIVNTLTNRQSSQTAASPPASNPKPSSTSADDSSPASQYSTHSGPQQVVAKAVTNQS